jgi:hypothetical protein
LCLSWAPRTSALRSHVSSERTPSQRAEKNLSCKHPPGHSRKRWPATTASCLYPDSWSWDFLGPIGKWDWKCRRIENTLPLRVLLSSESDTPAWKSHSHNGCHQEAGDRYALCWHHES